MNKTRILLLGILAGFAAFIAGKITWALLPWHHSMFQTLENPTVLEQTLQASAPKAGVYLLPAPPSLAGLSDEQMRAEQKAFVLKKTTQLSALIAVKPQGALAFGRAILFTIWANMFSGILLAYLLSLLPLTFSYWQKFSALLVAVAAGTITSQAPYFAWWDFPDQFVLGSIADQVIAWALAISILLKLQYFPASAPALPRTSNAELSQESSKQQP